jgi:predicted ATPase
MKQLTTETKEMLMVAACFGSHLEQDLLTYVLERDFLNSLNEGFAAGVLIIDKARRGYAFAHNAFQEAAYGLIADDERELSHVEIGRKRWRSFDKEELDRNIFMLLSQFNIGKRLIMREKGCMDLAALCLHAGTKVAKSSSFDTAAVYLNLGVELAGDLGWREEYMLTIALCNAGAEMEMCSGNFLRMNVLVDQIIECGRREVDKIQAYATRMYALGVSNRQDESLDLGLKVLKSLGEAIPPCPSKLQIIVKMKYISAQSTPLNPRVNYMTLTMGCKSA